MLSKGLMLRRIRRKQQKYMAASDADLAAAYQRLRGMEPRRAACDVFAIAAAAFVRKLNLNPYDEQLLGALAMANGCVAQLQTGEGKTVTAVLTAALLALRGKGVHIATVNSYLAERDYSWMKPVYDALGITASVLLSDIEHPDRGPCYACDVVYGVHHDFGFDYLRDQLAQSADGQVQPAPAHMLVDEVDSILLDEAVTPMLLSGQGTITDEKLLAIVDKFVCYLRGTEVAELDDDEDYYRLDSAFDCIVERRNKAAILTSAGNQKAEQYFRVKSLSDWPEMSHALFQCLQARYAYHRDVDYLVQDDEIIIIDSHTGRQMQGRRFCDGLWQALAVKEGVKIIPESITVASISFQQFFKRYPHLCGMTGTAKEGSNEFGEIYRMAVKVIRPHKKCIRRDLPDVFCDSEDDKLDRIIREISAAHARRQPCLIVTRTVEENEKLSAALSAVNVPHRVLNAKQYAEEAQVIANAGNAGSITVATAMAGRGTDIRLDDEACALGGLYVIGYGHQNTRRGDRQLIGRCARQSDPGMSRFFVSPQDELIVHYAGGKLPEGAAARRRCVIACQKAYEGVAAAQRKSMGELDGIITGYRNCVYDWRNGVLHGDLPDFLPECNAPKELQRSIVLKLLDAAWMQFLSEAEDARQNCCVQSMTGHNYQFAYVHDVNETFENMRNQLMRDISDRIGALDGADASTEAKP